MTTKESVPAFDRYRTQRVIALSDYMPEPFALSESAITIPELRNEDPLLQERQPMGEYLWWMGVRTCLIHTS